MAELHEVDHREVAQPVMMEGRSMIILYGSETGNAQEIATELSIMARRLHFQTVVDEMDSFKLTDLLAHQLAVFVTSTSGQGELPKNTDKFWRNLRRQKLNGTNCLAKVNFSIFGLGDSSYPKFNWAARKLRVRLLQLGAHEFFRPGEGDERHDNGWVLGYPTPSVIDSIWVPWFQELQDTLAAECPLPDGVRPIPDDVQLPPRYTLRLATPMDLDHQMKMESEEEARALERKFQATKTKSAVQSHVDHPRSKDMDLEDMWERNKATFPADIARRSAAWENQNHRRVDSLDKDNIITDHPHKYLLEPRSENQTFPPPDMLNIPHALHAQVLHNIRVTPADHWQDVRKISLDVLLDRPEDFPSCAAGSTVTIYPKNYPEDAQKLIDMMGWGPDADKPLAWGVAVGKEDSPEQLHAMRPPRLYTKKAPCTLRDLLIHNLDITAIPKRNFLRELAFFTREENEKERLRQLSSFGPDQEFYDYTSRPRRTILEVLRDFPGVKIPLDRALDMFPFIRGRDFSIANGGDSIRRTDDSYVIRIELLVALVEYKTIFKKPREGLCSRYLKNLPEEIHLRLDIKLPTTGKLITDGNSCRRPLIAIATGTGIAPIRALIQDRARFFNRGPTLLFYGCRNENADYFFKKEWVGIPGLEVFPAFSRDPVSPGDQEALERYENKLDMTNGAIPGLPGLQYDAGKNYVQLQIRKQAQKIGELMRHNPLVCVCGNSGRMPSSVRDALLDCLVISKIVSNKEEANHWFDNQRNLIFWQETW
ncbi:hypothetical protein B0T22DRAFT_379313 [Podospora appendiculata]|uniref:Uncharacterized protein n=1 Tax=Podospora appendiculata TaxID=314037 RepID=A0AAE0X9R6_9PEZI|nr:hypothetical protein B0T22DRAFT_379313 [Podospora appendiculata]